MIVLFLCLVSILWFCNTPFCGTWSQVSLDLGQIQLTVSALVIVAYLVVGCISFGVWCCRRRP